MQPFHRFQLRTRDVDGARRFYADALGIVLDDRAGEIVPLPAAAAARGAPSHWLGYLGAADVAATTEALVAIGFTTLGPVGAASVLRDPLGAVVGVIDAGERSRLPIAWCDHNSVDHAQALAAYAPTFGWVGTAVHQLGPTLTYQEVAVGGGASFGALCNAALRPEVHPHWAYYLAVDDLELAAARVVDCGGAVILPATAAPGGARFAYCHDAHGAAFGVRQRAAA